MQVQLVIFSAQKDGCSPADWEDAAGGGSFGRGHGGDAPCARFAVADGATEAYDSGRWASQLIASFISPEQANGAGHPDLEREAMSAWFKAMQDQWQVDIPATSDYIEQLKIRQGTLATFVGGQLTGLDSGNPVWHAVALGDSVLFHVRDGRLITHLPELGSGDFDSTPEGISTVPGRLNQMSGQLEFQRGRLAPGDTIFVATDAFAKWMITRVERRNEKLWPMLGSIGHPSVFTRLVNAERRAKALKDDDVTLMRIRLLPRRASRLVVCL
jgi:Protein phosphatase 2C